jgi:general secretion pathway protein N
MRSWIALALFLFLLLAATLPLRLALGWAGADRFVSAARVEGTVWNGRLQDAQLRGLSLGDISLGLDIPALLTGRLALNYAADGAPRRNGAILRGVLRLEDGDWRMESRKEQGSLAL